MAILKNQEIHFVKLDPNRPDKGMGTAAQPPKPNWSVTIRTTDKAVRKTWTEMGITSKAVREDKTDEESKILYYQATLRKNANTLKNNVLVPAKPVDIVDGKHQDIDPNSVGNGSIANLMLFERKYKLEGVDKVSWILMKVQVVKLKVYVHKPMEEFEDCDTEVITPEDKPNGGTAGDTDSDLY